MVYSGRSPPGFCVVVTGAAVDGVVVVGVVVVGSVVVGSVAPDSSVVIPGGRVIINQNYQ